MIIERLPPMLVPGWDCITGNHCKDAGKPGLNHGVHGDEFIYGIRAELPDGRMAAITLEIFTSRYPVTVEQWRRDRLGMREMPYGASLDLHLQIAKDAPAPDYRSLNEKCDWLGPNRRCSSDGSSLCASDVYRKYGIQSDAPDVDLMQQLDALYEEMARFLKLWTEGK